MKAKKNAIVMHPLPHVDEVAADVDYVRALEHLGERALVDSENFVSFVTHGAHLQVALAFGTDSDEKPAMRVVKERLYRLGFFSEERSVRDTKERLLEQRYSFSDSVLSNALRDLSIGRSAILSRSKLNGIYVYRERLPPDEYFTSIL